MGWDKLDVPNRFETVYAVRMDGQLIRRGLDAKDELVAF
jgi:hypothetical protein